MEGIRHRKAGSDGISPQSGKFDMGVGQSSYRFLRKMFYFLGFISLALMILLTVNNTWPFRSKSHSTNVFDQVSVQIGVQEKVYAVIIDAGSTGSRVLAFTFFRSPSERSNWKTRHRFRSKVPLSVITNNSSYDDTLKLHDELWHEVKPGLSSYEDDPVKGAESLLDLLKLAKEKIPQEKWSQTPLVLKATAGLRLLPEEKANALLDQVRKVLQNSGFRTSESSVGIMDGKDEGIFSWFTVNYLMDQIHGEFSDTLVALDLGGGSTQITFIPGLDESKNAADKDDLVSVSLMQKQVDIFTHSFLGLGLMAARKAIFEKDGINEEKLVHSNCVNPIIDTDWHYAGETYKIKGPTEPKYENIPGQAGRLSEKRPIADYEACLNTAIQVIKEKVPNIPDELKTREVIAFSYFFDRAMEKGLIDPFNGGVITVEEFARGAKDACGIPNTEQPFACIDLTFIASLLQHGYNLKPSTLIRLYKKIDGYEVSWGLGLAFHIINNGI